MRTNVEITEQTTGNEIVKYSVSYINPEATNAVCKGFGQQFAALSTNTYVSSERLNRIPLDEEEGGE